MSHHLSSLQNKKTIGAVITGGDFQGLGALRCLARRNIPVYLVDNDLCIGRFSRYTQQFARSPMPADEKRYVDFLLGLAKRDHLEGWVIYPNSDEIVSVLSRNKERLESCYRVTTPLWKTTQYAYNKKLTYQLAQKLGIAIPKTYYPGDIEDIHRLEPEFPVIIKPAIRDKFYHKTKMKAFRIENRNELREIYAKVSSIIDPSEILIQEYIPGGPKNLYSFCPLFKEGQVLAGITGRRSRQHPMDFGHASTFVESVEIPELEKISVKILQAINYYGLAEVEFMQDPRNGQFKLIEINPRIWGWHTLAVGAGIDLPYLLYQDMVDVAIEVRPSAKKAKWVRMITDLPTVFSEIIRGRLTLKEYRESLHGEKTFAVFTIKDPLPCIMEFLMIPYLWYKRGF